MRSLWFKRRYVGPILSGQKRDTLRAKPPARLDTGEIVAASVGPIRPFALLRIEAIQPVTLADLDAETRAAFRAIYPAAEAETVWHIRFRVIERIAPEQAAD
jgi:hypothetical protein